MEVKYIEFKDSKVQNWSGGTTYQYYIYPNVSTYLSRDFLFRISLASIESDVSTFTRFIGYDRYLMMLDESLKIKVNNELINIEKEEILKFKSIDECISYSKGFDFNFMINERVANHSFEILKENITTSAQFIVLFANELCNLDINGKKYNMKHRSCIIIENLEQSKISFLTSDHLFVGLINS